VLQLHPIPTYQFQNVGVDAADGAAVITFTLNVFPLLIPSCGKCYSLQLYRRYNKTFEIKDTCKIGPVTWPHAMEKKESKLRGLSPRTNDTDQATAACRRT
jgi:hypothetical protein